MIRLETSTPWPATAMEVSRKVRRSRRAPRRVSRRPGRPGRVARGAALISLGFVVGLGAAGELKVDAAQIGSASRAAAAAVPAAGPSVICQRKAGVPMRLVVARPGDTVWRLAVRYAASDAPIRDSVEGILTANGLHSDAVIQPGQGILVPR